MKTLMNSILPLAIIGILMIAGNPVYSQNGQYGVAGQGGSEHGHGRMGQRRPGGQEDHQGGFWQLLTEEQQTELKAKIAELKEAGATREEIHTAVTELLTGWGIEMPERPERGRGMQPGHQRLMNYLDEILTEEQLTQVKATIDELREGGSTREEIHAAVVELLTSYGIELPERDRQGRMEQLKEILTAEQFAEVEALIADMRNADASREDIHAAVVELLESWGIEPPGPREDRHQRLVSREIWEQLSDEQRQTVRTTIHDMRKDGADRDAIREAVEALLTSWGIDLPEDESEGDAVDPGGMKKTLRGENYPNPFNPETTISYTLPEEADVMVRIFNINGQLIRTLTSGHQNAGTYTVIWDGLSQSGSRVVSGTYFYRIDAGPQTMTQRMILLK